MNSEPRFQKIGLTHRSSNHTQSTTAAKEVAEEAKQVGKGGLETPLRAVAEETTSSEKSSGETASSIGVRSVNLNSSVSGEGPKIMAEEILK